MQPIVRFLTEMRDEIASIPLTLKSPNHYYFSGQVDLIDRLIRTIGEGDLNVGTGRLQGGIELLSAEES